MYKSVLNEWTRRLESGEYTQGVSRLRYKSEEGVTKYCCLGVLSDMAVEKGILSLAENHTRDEVIRTGNGFGADRENVWIDAYRDTISVDGEEEEYYEDSLLPESVQSWAGIHDNNPCVVTEETDDVIEEDFLSEMNDIGYGFNDIADLIRNGMKVEDDSDNPVWS